jgi:hypothetical protein
VISPAHRQAAERVALYLTSQQAKATARPWTALEAAFYEILRRLLADEANSLAANILAHGSTAAVNDATWWAFHQAQLLDELAHQTGLIARLGAQAAREALGQPAIAVNWGLVNRGAVDWASSHAAALVRNVEPVTRQAVQQAVSDWAASGQPLSNLAGRIRDLSSAEGGAFSPARAQRIAQTESTNAFAQGNVLAWEAAGVQRAAYQPAAHVNCRCYLQPFRMPDGTFVMVWYTAHDERVCVQPLETPWGEVAGCRNLHDTIVSHGQWLGQKKP